MAFFKSILRFTLYWLVIFSIQRVFFNYYHADKLSAVDTATLQKIYLFGIRLDFAMIGYFLMVPLLGYIIGLIFSKSRNVIERIIQSYTIVLTIVVVIIGIVDLHIYTEWGNKINARALSFFFTSPNEAMASSASSPLLFSFLAISIQLLVYIIIIRRWLKFKFGNLSHTWMSIAAIPVFAISIIIFARGGIQLAPINQSAAYFSALPAVNHTSVNTIWNLMHSFLENHFSDENPYMYMSEAEASAIVDSLQSYDRNATEFVLNNKRPNIMLVILESFTSDVVGSFGGEPKVSPYLSALADEGLSFKNIYASGDRTDKGLIAILSGFPAQAVRSIIQQPDKFEKLPSMPHRLAKEGYDLAFFYGGESEFSNMKSYLYSAGYYTIIDKKDFQPSEMNSKWGAHDGYLFDKVIEKSKTLKEPFLATVLTLSSHEPFEVPIKSSYTATDLSTQFKKAANYTDKCINDFMQKAKREPWYANTLFIFVADHGHRLPRRYKHAYNYKKYRIPLIFYGDVLMEEKRARSVYKIGSQTDIAATLYQQMGIEDTSMRWSKDLLNETSHNFAFFTYDNGLGWVDPQQIYTSSNINKMIITMKVKRDKDIKKRLKLGRAYMQEVFSTYVNY